jgi:hypothetical protein
MKMIEPQSSDPMTIHVSPDAPFALRVVTTEDPDILLEIAANGALTINAAFHANAGVTLAGGVTIRTCQGQPADDAVNGSLRISLSDGAWYRRTNGQWAAA